MRASSMAKGAEASEGVLCLTATGKCALQSTARGAAAKPRSPPEQRWAKPTVAGPISRYRFPTHRKDRRREDRPNLDADWLRSYGPCQLGWSVVGMGLARRCRALGLAANNRLMRDGAWPVARPVAWTGRRDRDAPKPSQSHLALPSPLCAGKSPSPEILPPPLPPTTERVAAGRACLLQYQPLKH